MRARIFAATAIVAVAAGAALGACNRNDDGEGSRSVDVLVVAIREVVDAEPTTGPDDEEAIPVVYVVGFGEYEVAATVQSDVVAALQDEVDVRFADQRDEAIKTDEPDQPVLDSGVLLVVAETPDGRPPIDVPIEIYRSAGDASTIVFTFAERASSWVVTATSQVTVDA